MDMIGLATLAMDVMLQVDSLPGEDGFAVVIKNTYVPGGSGTNVMVQAARLGASCGFIGQVGDDSLGKDILKSLISEGVDISGMRVKPGGISLHTDIVVDKEGRKFILLNMGDTFLTLEESKVDRDYLKSAKIFYTDLLPGGPAIAALKEAKAAGMKTAFNMQVGLEAMTGFGVDRNQILSSLADVDLFAPCRDGLYALCGTQDPEACRDFLRPWFRGTLLITLGSQGSVAFDEKDSRFEQPVISVQAADTTGAGDAYMGGMLYSYLLNNMPLDEAMRFSTACSAYTCMGLGARSGPNLAQVRSFIQNNEYI
ncbi:carbohydrate kinase family protein [Sinanaerobacter chloroacetimidivorans]|uniref:Carbohydrate kinase family protein n=1 Tax=Sinanaerobacter chloroacetimidivorans TaxID=2818044 RepID=A0A8J8B1Z5_9FIRM|nr:carbohydrate kinase family protein [Sinanaerobacter chloroacetimidivorans]MBR0598237.1 carbohydrate kinase family protein [Sinanaerobacter chloroacetimidivorans]